MLCLQTGIYEITVLRLYAELKAYDAGFLKILHDQLDELLQEDDSKQQFLMVLEEKNLVILSKLSSQGKEERRELLCMRGAIDVNLLIKQPFKYLEIRRD